MDVETLEREVLKLSAEDLARLLQELLESLDELPPQEIDRLWLSEAGRRAEEIDSGHIELIEGDEVDRKARSLLR